VNPTIEKETNAMTVPGFTAEVSLYQTTRSYRQAARWAGSTVESPVDAKRALYVGGESWRQGGTTIQPAQIGFFDPCLFGGPRISVGWQLVRDGLGVVVVTGHGFAARSGVRLRLDNCTSAFPDLAFGNTNACGEFTISHKCTCDGPAITVSADDGRGNFADGGVRQTC